MSKNERIVEVEVFFITQTDASINVSSDEDDVEGSFIAKSQIRNLDDVIDAIDDGEDYIDIVIPEWLAQQEGLI